MLLRIVLVAIGAALALPLQHPLSSLKGSKRDAPLLHVRQGPPEPVIGKGTPLAVGSYPRLGRSTQGSLFAMVTMYEGHGRQSLNLYQSADSGVTFSPLGIAASVSNGNDLDNGQFVQLPARMALGGHRILVAFRNHSRSEADGSYTEYRLGACFSDDLGKTFHGCNNIVYRPAQGVNGLWEPFLRVTATGDVQVVYASESSEYQQQILAQTSTDGGETWGPSTPVTAAGLGRDGMPGVASYIDTSDGTQKLLCVFENTLDSKEMHQGFRVFSMISDDDGQTWGQRSLVYSPTGTGNNAGSPQVTTSTQNELVVSFMTDEDTQDHDWIEGADMKIVVSLAPSSVQPAFVWGEKTTVFTPQANWPGLVTMGNGDVLGAAVFQNIATIKPIELV